MRKYQYVPVAVDIKLIFSEYLINFLFRTSLCLFVDPLLSTRNRSSGTGLMVRKAAALLISQVKGKAFVGDFSCEIELEFYF